MIQKRKALTALAAAGVLVGLTACAGNNAAETKEETTASSSDSTLVIYSGRDEKLIGPLIEKFEETSGIKTEVRYAGSAEQAQLLITEGKNTPAHVFLSQEAGALGQVAENDLLAKLPAEFTDAIPEEYTDPEGEWVGITGRARVVAYDSEQVAEEDVPDTVAEIIDPKWAGQTGVAPGNASFLSFVTALRVTEGDDAAKEWLTSLAGNDPKTYEKNTAILEAVNSGEVQIGLINHYYWYKTAAEVGADNMRAKLKFGQSGDVAALVNATGVGILSGAADNKQAHEFVKFLLSKEAQQYFVENTYEYPLLPGVDAPEGVPPLESLKGPKLDLSDLGTVAETTKLIEEAGLTVG